MVHKKKSQTLGLLIILVLVVLLGFSLYYFSGQFLQKENSEDKTELRLIDSDEFIPVFTDSNNCPFSSGEDIDGDGFFDECDNCPLHYNPEQFDEDFDLAGDICDYNNGERIFVSDDDDDDDEVNCDSNLDCGVDGFVGSSSCSVNNVVRDFRNFTCNNPGTSQSSCSSNVTSQIVTICNFGCDLGQCLPENNFLCMNDNDCVDGNPLTFDSCVFTATNSSCTHAPIVCASNSDCGNNGFIGNNMCSVNNVVRDFRSFTCNNAGTIQSSCSSNVTSQIVEQCSDLCSNGACVDVACFMNSDCSDNNSTTTDVCILPGSAQSYCLNTPQSCTSQCTFGSKQCFANGFQVCDDFDGNGCFEWSLTLPCNSGVQCNMGVCV